MRIALFVACSLALLHGAARADDGPPSTYEPNPPPTYEPNRPAYVAPLSQTTQSTYVPQSVALSGPEEIDDLEGRRAPDGYTPVKRTRKGLLIGGGITLGAAYMYSALFAAMGEDTSSYDSYDGSSNRNEFAAMWIPIAGPFIQMANGDSATEKLLLAGLGGAQVTGAILLYYGLTSKKTVYVRNDLLGVAPMAGHPGLVVSGRF